MTTPTLTQRAEAFLERTLLSQIGITVTSETWADFEKIIESDARSREIIKGLMAEIAEAWSECRDNEALIKQLGDQVDGLMAERKRLKADKIEAIGHYNRVLNDRRSLMEGIELMSQALGDFMPNIGSCCLQDIGRINQALLFGERNRAALKTAKGTT